MPTRYSVLGSRPSPNARVAMRVPGTWRRPGIGHRWDTRPHGPCAASPAQGALLATPDGGLLWLPRPSPISHSGNGAVRGKGAGAALEFSSQKQQHNLPGFVVPTSLCPSLLEVPLGCGWDGPRTPDSRGFQGASICCAVSGKLAPWDGKTTCSWVGSGRTGGNGAVLGGQHPAATTPWPLSPRTTGSHSHYLLPRRLTAHSRSRISP